MSGYRLQGFNVENLPCKDCIFNHGAFNISCFHMLRWTALWTFTVNTIYTVLVLWVLRRHVKLETGRSRQSQPKLRASSMAILSNDSDIHRYPVRRAQVWRVNYTHEFYGADIQ
jgi:hypothetical protein